MNDQMNHQNSKRVHTAAWWLILALLAAAVALILMPRAAGAQRAGPDAGVGRGELLVQQKCARCHATGRADASPNPKAPPFRTVGRNYPLDHLAEALAEGIITGDNDMPQFKFDPNDIDAILDYIADLSMPLPKGKATPPKGK